MWRFVLGVVLIAGHFLTAAWFKGRVARLMARVGEGSTVPMTGEIPEVVREFVRRAGVEGSTARTVRYRQAARMLFDPEGSWQEITAVQVFGVETASFVWFAEWRFGPLALVRVVDALVDDAGRFEVRLLGTLPLGCVTGPELDRGEAMRYLAELPWVPEAMVRNGSLRWRELDDRRVEVSMDTSGGPATVRLIFEDGDVVAIEADDRPRQEGKVSVERPWEGRFWEYRSIGGRRVPAKAEVSWVLPEGRFAYFRGEMLDG
ncbi:MAG: DUF6544 family protein [Acidobacteriota bacterium]